jgi:hypothetical protein
VVYNGLACAEREERKDFTRARCWILALQKFRGEHDKKGSCSRLQPPLSSQGKESRNLHVYSLKTKTRV